MTGSNKMNDFPFYHKNYACSMWSLASKEELEAALAKWRRMLDDGTADQFIAEIEEKRKRVGISTSIIAYKDCV